MTFDKKTLQILVEKYMTKKIFQEDVLNFLRESLPKSKDLNVELVTKTSKSASTIYKAFNEIATFTSISWARYWLALVKVAEENNISIEKVPSLDRILLENRDFIELINQSSLDDSFNDLIINNIDALTKVIQFCEKYEHKLSNKEITVIELIKEHPEIKVKIKQDKALQLMLKRERMRRT